MTRIVITAAVIVHLVASLWHGSEHTHLGIELSTQQTLFVYLVIIIAPVIAGILVWTRYVSIGLWVFFLAMLGGFLFGVYHHYVLVSQTILATCRRVLHNHTPTLQPAPA